MPDTADATAAHRIDRAGETGAEASPWARIREDLRADRAHWHRRGWSRARLARGYHAVWLYRLSRYAHERGWRVAAWLLWLVNGWWTGADIPPSSRIAGGLFLPYPYGAVIAGAVGRDVAFGVQASIGGLLKEPDRDVGGGAGLPVVGDGVVLEAGALVLGAVRVGDAVRLGPRAVVLKDVARGETVMAQPWRALPGRGGAA